MDDFVEKINQYYLNGLTKLICSNPASKAEPYRRIVFQKKKEGYQQECYTEKQVFHKNMSADEAAAETIRLFGTHMRQLNLFIRDTAGEYTVEYRFSKAGKVFVSVNRENGAAKPEELAHNRKKNYLIPEGTVIPALVDMGIFTKEGKVVASMQDKFRQINRFVEMVEDGFEALPKDRPIHILDFGCGKSYLTFILYYYFTEIKKKEVHITGLDLKADVIANCNRAAKAYGYENLHFEVGDVNAFESRTDIDMVVTLHACDTATDYALYHAIRFKASLILSVPCCQHELNKQMKTEELSILTRYGIIQERTAALLTDAIRANMLIANGYKAQVLEFVDMSHTPKNLLIRATRCFQPPSVKRRALEEAEQAMQAFAVRPTIVKLLEGGASTQTEEN